MDSIGRVATLIDQIVAFLHSVGVDAREGAVPGASFLPGIHISSGQVLFDRSRLQWSGDLLHEAGNVAVTPGGQRALLNGALSERADAYQDGEVEPIAASTASIRGTAAYPGMICWLRP